MSKILTQDDLDQIQQIYYLVQLRVARKIATSAVRRDADEDDRATGAGISRSSARLRLKRLASQIVNRLDENLKKQLRLPKLELPQPKAWVRDFVSQHATLIKVASERGSKTAVRDLLQEHQGLHVDALTKKVMQKGLGVSEARARMWSVDQTLKLYSAATKQRQEAAGVEEYVWTDSGGSSGDGPGEVRPSHRALDGRTFRWDDPPVTNEEGDRNHPGEDYNCRCTAYPVTAASAILRGK